MKRWAALLLLATGCSTAPVADVLDFVTPGRLSADQTPPYGGVCGPQSTAPGGPSTPLAVIAPPAAATAPPPAIPIPPPPPASGAPPGSIPLGPPTPPGGSS